MNFTGPYDKQLAAQPQPSLLTPLLAGWEFRERPTLLTGSAGWRALAKMQNWALTAPVRHDLLSDQWVIVVTDTNQVIQYVNPHFETMTGYNSYEAVGRRPAFLQGKDTSIVTRNRIRQAIELKKSVSEKVLNYRKDSTPYWCQIVIRPIANQQKEIVNFIAFEKEISADEAAVEQ
ncbi:PAS domain-containing protein [Spirosoma aerophilum]